MKKGMEESYIEDLANRDGPDHALATREGAAKRWFRGGAPGRLLSLEIGKVGVPTCCGSAEGNIVGGVMREPSSDLAGSENPCMRVISSC